MVRLLVSVVCCLTVLGLALGHLQPRIVGGSFAKNNQFPYQVSLEYLFRFFCGGAILTPTVVITAANCKHDSFKRVSFIQVRVGTTYKEGNGQTVKAQAFIKHPNFNPKTLDYDIALLRVEKPLVFEDGVQPIKLPARGQKQPTGAMATISGWGSKRENEDFTPYLRFAQVPIEDRDYCKTKIAGFTDRMICAGYPEGRIDACTADSGGPMTFKGELVGIITWRNECARPNSPGVYTHVAMLREWIDDTISNFEEF
uniref:Venom polypeptide n=1 Tax=Dolopus genitalis TaxID=2488630 RepID=A0A3G5BIM8_DOLGE|nr:venom polypeptide [Dolopus genitalis]